MQKSSVKVSQQGIRRAEKNKIRLQNRKAKMDNHVDFLYKAISSGKITLDFDKLMAKQVGENTIYRNHKDTKYIIDRLVSLQELNK